MIFTLTSAAQEWIAEIKRHEGTVVTLESFLAWKCKFDEERLSKCKIEKKKADKLTGREMFTSNQDMDISDLQFLEEEA